MVIGILRDYLCSPFAYLQMTIAMAFLSQWVGWGKWPAVSCGALAAGAVFALGLGMILLPSSVLGLLAVIGVLGFSPFLSSITYARNAWRAWSTARVLMPARKLCGIVIASFLLALGGLALTQWKVNREISRAQMDILSEDASEAANGIAVFRRLGPFGGLDGLALSYDREKNPGRRQRLADAYTRITQGGDIENRLGQIVD